ncbi:MAG: molybdenum cofactor biosynthesis protein MoaE, partial [Syntrophales bacterium]|nr:molybdenum cofactor biosynthesis protein MoaE [Syntrophales bacterium]
MELNDLIAAVKKRPDFPKVGMILCHNGVVRATSRDGLRVSSVTVAVNYTRLATLVAEMKKRPGIV